jgi:hypothetical protein
MSRLSSVALASMLLVAGAATARAELIVNGGFETGNFSGWSVSPSDDPFISVGSDNPHSGRFAADLGTIGELGHISQSFADTPGQALTVSFWFASDGEQPNELRARFDGITRFDEINGGPHGYVQESFAVVATGHDTLTFDERNDPGFLNLDDVSVAARAIPEPTSLSLLGAALIGLGIARRRRSGR